MAKPHPPAESNPPDLSRQASTHPSSSHTHNHLTTTIPQHQPTDYSITDLQKSFQIFKDLAIAELEKQQLSLPKCFEEVEKEVSMLLRMKLRKEERDGDWTKNPKKLKKEKRWMAIVGLFEKLKGRKKKENEKSSTTRAAESEHEEEDIGVSVVGQEDTKAKGDEEIIIQATKNGEVNMQSAANEDIKSILDLLDLANNRASQLGLVIREIAEAQNDLLRKELEGFSVISSTIEAESKGEISADFQEPATLSQELLPSAREPLLLNPAEYLGQTPTESEIKESKTFVTSQQVSIGKEEPQPTLAQPSKKIESNNFARDKLKLKKPKHADALTQFTDQGTQTSSDLALQTQILRLEAEIKALKTKHNEDLELREPLLQI